MNWLSNIKNIPEKVFLIHGEPSVLDAFRVKIEHVHNWNVRIPKITDVEKLII